MLSGMSAPRQDADWWRRRASLLTDLQRRTARRVASSKRVPGLGLVLGQERPRRQDG
jgi:hypothetical protein